MRQVLLLASLPIVFCWAVFAQDTKPEPCPEITVFGPPSNLEINQTGKYSALLDMKGFNREISYKWSAIGGEIVDGQGTTEVEVKKTEKNLRVEIEVDGFRRRCNHVASKTEQIIIVPEAIKLDHFTGPLSDVSQERIKNIVTEIRSHPEQVLWIYLGFDRNLEKKAAHGRVETLMEAFRKERFGHDDRITFVEIESDHEFIEFWRSTPNARPPGLNSN